jgi:hypothetical protein
MVKIFKISVLQATISASITYQQQTTTHSNKRRDRSLVPRDFGRGSTHADASIWIGTQRGIPERGLRKSVQQKRHPMRVPLD